MLLLIHRQDALPLSRHDLLLLSLGCGRRLGAGRNGVRVSVDRHTLIAGLGRGCRRGSLRARPGNAQLAAEKAQRVKTGAVLRLSLSTVCTIGFPLDEAAVAVDTVEDARAASAVPPGASVSLLGSLSCEQFPEVG